MLAATSLAVVTAACGGHPVRHVDRSTARQGGALAFSHCMRSHGVAQFPDPESSGAIPKVTLQQLGVDSSRFQTAEDACRSLLQPTDAEAQQTLSGMLDFAHCMRSHGVRNWPDPTTGSDGEAAFDLQGRIDPNTPQMDTTSGKCAHLLHPTPGQDGTVLCNGVGEAGCHHYG